MQTNATLRFAGEPWGSAESQKLVQNYLSKKALLRYESNRSFIESRIAEFVSNPGKFGAEYLGLISGAQKQAEFLRADLFVLPSYSEGFSMSVLEALSYGLPVVATPVGALGEIVTHERNGLIVPVGEPGDLSQAICRLLAHQRQREFMAKVNRDYVRKKFHLKKIAQELETILASAAS
jgi:glycosyltransferase involved in cell wall biosynthesis